MKTNTLSGRSGTVLWLVVFISVFIWSAIHPHDYMTWLLEVTPAILGLAVLSFTRNKFPLTQMTYVLILVHSVVLMIGGHYTYAEVPMFEQLGAVFGSERNNYDKLGHFFQGFVPAIVAREILVRLRVVNGRVWMNFIIVCICLAISAVYELIEWGVAVISSTAAESFLGTQGYVWDTQSDIAWAMSGAIIALAVLGRPHDRQLSTLR